MRAGVFSARHAGILLWGAFVLAVVLLEVFCFNAGHWATASLEPQVLAKDLVLDEPGEGEGVSFEEPIDIVTLDIAADKPCAISLVLVDEGRSAGYPVEVDIVPSYEAGHIVEVHPYGAVLALGVELAVPDEGSIERSIFKEQVVRISTITANVPIPFRFSFLRVAVLLVLGLMVWGFSTRRAWFKMPFSQGSVTKAGKVATASCACVASLVLIACAFVNSGELGSFQKDALTGEVTYEEVIASDYADLARAFAAGQLSLLEEPPGWLEDLDNPYDTTQRKGQVTSSRWDACYFDGAYYVYFGVLPALVFYLPFYLITGHDFPTVVASFGCAAAAVVGICVLMALIARRFFRGSSVGAVALCQLLAALSGLLVWGTRLPNVYTLPVIMAWMLVVWGMVCYLCLDRRPWLAVVGSCAFAAVFACRPQVGAFCLLAVPLGVQALRGLRPGHRKPGEALQEGEGSEGGVAVSVSQGRRLKAAYLAAAVAPFIVVLALLGAYNFMRFGSPFDFGANYNLTTNDMTRRPLSADLMLVSLYYLLAQLPVVVPSVPFFEETTMPLAYNGLLISEPMWGGAIWLVPVGWFALALWRIRSARSYLVAGGALVVVVAAFDGLFAGVLPRYQMDFALPLALFGAVGLMALLPSWAQCAEEGKPAHSWAVRCGVLCLVVALAVNASVVFHPSLNTFELIAGTWEMTGYARSLLF